MDKKEEPKSTSTGLIVFFILLFMFFVSVTSMAGDSAIRDEMPHITAGYSYLTKGDYRLNPEHPPLIKDLAAFPLLFLKPNFPTQHWQSQVNDQWSEGEEFLYKSGNNADLMLFLGRIPVVLLSLLLGFFVFRWAFELYGPRAGIFALILYAFDANIIAHSRFITTDLGIAATVFINLYFLWKFLIEPSKKGLLLVAVTLAVALLTKFSAPILVITYAIVALYLIFRPRPYEKGTLLFTRFYNSDFVRRFLGYLFTFLLIGLISLFIVWFVYAIQTIHMPAEIFHRSIDEGIDAVSTSNILHKMANISILRPLEHYLLGFIMVSQHATGGHTAFLLGQVANGWWYYYIVAFFVKTAIPTMIFIASSIIFWIGRRNNKDHKAKVILLVPVFIFTYFALTTKIDLGVRYLLPIYPLLYVFVSFMAAKVSFKNIKNFSFKHISFDSAFSIIFFLLIIWYIISSVKIYPSYLSYFNELAGGPKNGMYYLTDSNIDWGQDMKRLANYVDEHYINKIRVDYFGGADPTYYLGNKFIPWQADKNPEKGYYAISVTYFQQARALNQYQWLKDKKPVATIGNSILVFNY